MDKINISRADVVWGYISQICNVGANLFILPILFYFLSSEILGVWYVFINIGMFTTLFGLVFQSTFARNISYAFGGVTSLREEDIDDSADILNEPNLSLLKSLILTMRRFYGLIAFGMFLVLLLAGIPYFYYLSSELLERDTILISWGVYVVSVSFTFYCHHFGSILQGRGYIKEFNQQVIISRLVYIILVYVFVSNGYSIWGIAVANIISSVVNYVTGSFFAYKNNLRRTLKQVQVQSENLMRVVWKNTYKLTFASLFVYISTKGNLFYVSMFFPLSVVANYGLSLQVINVLSTTSLLYFFSYSPLIAQGWVTKDMDVIKRIYTKSLVLGISIFCLGSLVVLLFGDWGLEIIGSNTKLLPTSALFLLLIVFLLDTNHSLAISLIVTRNRVPHLYASMWSALAIFVLIPIFVVKLGMGIYGVVLSVGVVHLCYQNWRWIQVAARSLDMTFFQQIKYGIQELLNVKIKTDA